MNTQQTKGDTPPRAPVEFQTIEPYEKMLIQRERDPLNYELQHSLAEKRAAEHYAIARAKAQRSK
jgi:hypothetical protein